MILRMIIANKNEKATVHVHQVHAIHRVQKYGPTKFVLGTVNRQSR